MDEPPVIVYMQHYENPVVDRLEAAGRWRAETDWPPPGADERALHLGEAGSLADAPGDDGADEFEYRATVGVTGGLWSGGLQFGLPGDQRPDEAFSLVYTSAPIEKDVHVLGRPRVVLHVSSTASVIGFAASLSDVAPDGTSHLVAKGMLNATRRDSLTDPEPLIPGEVYELSIEIDTTAWVFHAGHRIRLAIASADWPNVWPTPQPATNTVYRGEARPSRLILPSVPPRGSAKAPRFRPSQKAMIRHSDRADPPSWRIVHDVLGGRSQVRFHEAADERINDTTVVRREYTLVADCHPHDPASASAHGKHTEPDNTAELGDGRQFRRPDPGDRRPTSTSRSISSSG